MAGGELSPGPTRRTRQAFTGSSCARSIEACSDFAYAHLIQLSTTLCSPSSDRWLCLRDKLSRTLRVGFAARPAPGRRTLTAQGHPRAIFSRAIERASLAIAETTLRELGRPTLCELLELTILIAEKDPRRYARVSARWLGPRASGDSTEASTARTFAAFPTRLTRTAKPKSPSRAGLEGPYGIRTAS
jgi:hypothetical protein